MQCTLGAKRLSVSGSTALSASYARAGSPEILTPKFTLGAKRLSVSGSTALSASYARAGSPEILKLASRASG